MEGCIMRVMEQWRVILPTTYEKCQRQNIYIGLNSPAIAAITRRSKCKGTSQVIHLRVIRAVNYLVYIGFGYRQPFD